MVFNTSNSNNGRTLQSYQDKTQIYANATPEVYDIIKSWLDEALALIPRHGKILEVGSGFSRDAEYIRQKGFVIECSDAVPNFVTMLKQSPAAQPLNRRSARRL